MRFRPWSDSHGGSEPWSDSHGVSVPSLPSVPSSLPWRLPSVFTYVVYCSKYLPQKKILLTWGDVLDPRGPHRTRFVACLIGVFIWFPTDMHPV